MEHMKKSKLAINAANMKSLSGIKRDIERKTGLKLSLTALANTAIKSGLPLINSPTR